MATMIPRIIRRRTAIATAIAAGVLAGPMRGWAKGSYPPDRPSALWCRSRPAARRLPRAHRCANPQRVDELDLRHRKPDRGRRRPERRDRRRGPARWAHSPAGHRQYRRHQPVRLPQHRLRLPKSSFTPVALVPRCRTSSSCIRRSRRRLEEFVHHCKERGSDELAYGSPGLGATGHLTMEYLQSQAGIRLRHVAYGSHPG